MRLRVADAHPVVNDRAHLAVKHFIRIRNLLFERRRDRHQLERRSWLVHITHRAIGQRAGSNLFPQIRIEGRTVGQRQNLSRMRILNNHRPRNRTRVRDRLLQLLLRDVLNILVDRQDKILARLRLLLHVREPLPTRIHRDNHLPRLPAQLLIKSMFDAALPGILHADRSQHLRRQIARRIKPLRLFLKVNTLQAERLDALNRRQEQRCNRRP